MTKTSPTQRTLAKLRKDGWTACVVEKWNAHARVRSDAFGFGDVLACRGGILLVQATTTPNASARVKKALSLPTLRVWLEAGGSFEVWGWSKKGPRGKRKVWTLTIKRVDLDDLP